MSPTPDPGLQQPRGGSPHPHPPRQPSPQPCYDRSFSHPITCVCLYAPRTSCLLRLADFHEFGGVSFGWSDFEYQPGSKPNIHSERGPGGGDFKGHQSVPKSPGQLTQRGRPVRLLTRKARPCRHALSRRTNSGIHQKRQIASHHGGGPTSQALMGPHGTGQWSQDLLTCVGDKVG